MTVIPQRLARTSCSHRPQLGCAHRFRPSQWSRRRPCLAAASAGRQFWTLPVVLPATRLGNGLNKIGKLRIVFGVLAALFLVSRLTGVFGAARRRVSARAGRSPERYEVRGRRDCSDSAARYKVIAEEPDPSQCPANSDSYLDSKEDGDARYKCLVPVG